MSDTYLNTAPMTSLQKKSRIVKTKLWAGQHWDLGDIGSWATLTAGQHWQLGNIDSWATLVAVQIWELGDIGGGNYVSGKFNVPTTGGSHQFTTLSLHDSSKFYRVHLLLSWNQKNTSYRNHIMVIFHCFLSTVGAFWKALPRHFLPIPFYPLTAFYATFVSDSVFLTFPHL